MRHLIAAMLLLSVLIGWPRAAQAQVNSCIGAGGERVFTDQPCSNAGMRNGDGSDGTYAPGSGGSCPASPQALRQRVADAFDRDDPNEFAGLLDWSGYGHDGASAQLREYVKWLRRPLVGIHFNGEGDAPASRTDPTAIEDPVYTNAPASADSADASPQHDDAEQTPAPVRPHTLTVLTSARGGSDDDPAPGSRSFGVVQRGMCWWLTF